MTRGTVVVFAVGVAVLGAGAAPAWAWDQDAGPELRTSLGGSVVFSPSEQFADEVDTDARFTGSLGALVLPALELSFEGGRGETSYPLANGTTLDTDDRTYSLRAKYFVLPGGWARPYGTVSAGLMDTQLTSWDYGTELDDRVLSPIGDASVGMEVVFPGHFNFGFFHEIGYAYRGEQQVELSAAPGGDRVTIDLGGLSRGGLTLRAGLRFGLCIGRPRGE